MPESLDPDLQPRLPAFRQQGRAVRDCRGAAILPTGVTFKPRTRRMLCGPQPTPATWADQAVLARDCAERRLHLLFRHNTKRRRCAMAWTTPTLVEICIGLEINGYLPAEF
jgi:coenzyme PQQ precursor peptide PqqA